jgi:parallel beta-helix repeat protein
MNGWTSAIDLYLCRDGNVVRGNYIWGNSDEDPRDSEGHGITMDYCLAAGGALIENNVIWDNEGWCMAIYFSDGGTIRNNTCLMNGNPRSGTGEISVLGRNHALHNNILIPRPGRLALNLRERDPEYMGHLNTIQSDFNMLWGATHQDVVGYSISWRGTVAEFQVQNPYGWGGNTLQQDPHLLPNFTLTFSSPAIDSGDNAHAAAIDAAGLLRPWDGDGDGNAVVDRGAYEYFHFEVTDYVYLPNIRVHGGPTPHAPSFIITSE